MYRVAIVISLFPALLYNDLFERPKKLCVITHVLIDINRTTAEICNLIEKV